MKRLIGLTAFFLMFAPCGGALPADAARVTLAWDANSPAPDGYRLFQRTAGAAYNYASPAWSGAATTCTLTDLADSTYYYFVVRAFMGDDESGNSNEVAFRYDPPPAPTPEPTPSATPTPEPDPEPEPTPTPIPAPVVYHPADVDHDGCVGIDDMRAVVDAFGVCIDSGPVIIDPVLPAPICGNPASMIYHNAERWCGTGAVPFFSAAEAEAAGYRASAYFKP